MSTATISIRGVDGKVTTRPASDLPHIVPILRSLGAGWHTIVAGSPIQYRLRSCTGCGG